MKDLEKKQEKTRKGRLSRLVWANALALLTVTVTVLHVLGLLGSIFAFFF